ncbi:MAG: universal stress protein [Flavobacteriaceae bacterium]|nr:universal stress protein [Flavobacteriaceae bacterium]
MRRILLPTDFSENALNAIRYAVQLFKNSSCEFYLLHTYTPAAYNVGSMADSYSALELQKVPKQNAERSMYEVEETIRAEFKNKNHHFHKIVTFNLLVHEIQDIVETKGIDLIIMGTQGATGAQEVFLGTHTMYTIKKVKCPVIAVPSGFGYETPKEILFPTDYSLSTSNPYLSLIREISDLHTARLNILNAYYGEPLDKDQKQVKAYLDAYFKDNSHLFHIAENTDVQGAIEKFQVKHKINLLVMIHNRHNFFENLLFKPVINEIAYHTNIPFLVIPSEERMMH